MDEQHKSVIRDIKNGKYDVTPVEGEGAESLVFNERPWIRPSWSISSRRAMSIRWNWWWRNPLKPTFGTLFPLKVMARLCISQNPVPDAEITIRLISSLKKAVTLLSGRTDAEGLFQGQVELPPSQPGHCALLVGCSSDAGSDEMRVVIGA